MVARAPLAVAAVHGVEQRRVLVAGSAPAVGEQLEVVAGHDPYGLADVGQQTGRARRQVDGAVEAPVGRDDVVGASCDGGGQRAQLVQLGRRDACRGQLGPLAGQRGQDGEVVDGVLGRDADDRHSTPRRDGDQPLVGQFEQRLADRRAADAELRGEPVEVQAVARAQPPGQDAVPQLVGRLGPHGGADQFDI